MRGQLDGGVLARSCRPIVVAHRRTIMPAACVSSHVNHPHTGM